MFRFVSIHKLSLFPVLTLRSQLEDVPQPEQVDVLLDLAALLQVVDHVVDVVRLEPARHARQLQLLPVARSSRSVICQNEIEVRFWIRTKTAATSTLTLSLQQVQRTERTARAGAVLLAGDKQQVVETDPPEDVLLGQTVDADFLQRGRVVVAAVALDLHVVRVGGGAVEPVAVAVPPFDEFGFGLEQQR